MSAPDRRTFVLGSETHRQFVGSLIAATPPGWVVDLMPPRRSLGQNSRLHALLSEIADSGFALNGRRFTVDELKTLFVSAWMIETGKESDIVAGLDGHAVQLRRSTTTFTKEELGSLMDFIEAECAQRNIQLREPKADTEGEGVYAR